MFGWTEGDNTGEPGNPLILYTGAFGSSSTCCPANRSLQTPALDHFGLQVATLDRARTRSSSGPGPASEPTTRVQIIDVHARTTHGPTHDYTLTSAYIGFVLPLMIELQHLERHERVDS